MNKTASCHANEHAESLCTELALFKKYFFISLSLTIPILYLHMTQKLASLQALLSLGVILFSGLYIFKEATKSIVNFNLNMFSLIALGLTAAFLYSILAPFLGQYYHYYETIGVIVTLTNLGQYLEKKASAKTTSAIDSLVKLKPNFAWKVVQNIEIKVAVKTLQIGDIIRIKPGENISADGTITEGTTYVDESILTGESKPKKRELNDSVKAGTLNGNSSFLMRVDKKPEDFLLSQIVDMVKNASNSKPQLQNIVDSFSVYFIPIVLIIAFLTFIFWGFLTFSPSLALGVLNAASVLIVACPCSIGLATPLAITVAIGKGAKDGILIKNAQALQRMSEVNQLVVDKTGTLTEGTFQISHIELCGNLAEEEFIQLVASLEQASSHPIAVAIGAFAKSKKIMPLTVTTQEHYENLGIFGIIKGHTVGIGNFKLMNKLEVKVDHIIEKARSLQAEGDTVLFVTVDESCQGLIVIKDKIKDTTQEAITILHSEGLKIQMLTGDNRTTALKIAQELNIDEVEWDVLPQEKATIIKELQNKNLVVAMAGDGINDAIALKQADVGIAMGKGLEIAIKSASIVLINGDLRGIAKLRNLSSITMKKIGQNLKLSIIYNLIAIPIAAGLLYPFYGIFLSPMLASALMVLSSLSVVWNSLSIKIYQTKN